MTTSIIIPIYNVEAYLAKCLDSILVDNNYKEEVICVNDGSTDGSQSVLEKYAAQYSNIQIISQPNKGLSEARNTGLRAAHGDYVFFIDSDDWVAPNTLQNVIDKIEGEDVVYFNTKLYIDNIKQFTQSYDVLEHRHMNGLTYFETVINEKRNVSFVSVWGGVYNRKFLTNNNLWNEPGIYHEDNYFTPQVLLKAIDVSFINDFVYIYRIRSNGNITATIQPKHINDYLFICRNLYQIFSGYDYLPNAFYRFVANLYITLLCEAFGCSLPLSHWWNENDSLILYKCANSARQRKAAKLSFISPKLSYKYLTDSLPNIVRRFINRFL